MDRLLGFLFKKEPRYTKEELEKIIRSGRIIILIREKVYDVTNYTQYHPAGQRCFLMRNGKDCTVDMGYHSKKANDILKQYYIGVCS